MLGFKNEKYAEIFKNAKENTVYDHAMVWVRKRANENGKTEKDRFLEIAKIVEEALKNLEKNE